MADGPLPRKLLSNSARQSVERSSFNTLLQRWRSKRLLRLSKPLLAGSAVETLPASLAATALVFVVVTVAFICVYIATRTSDYSSDALEIASNIIGFRHSHNRSLLLKPEYLLYQPLGLAVWRACLEMGYVGGVLPVLQVINAIAGGLGLGTLSVLLRTILAKNRAISILIPAALGLSFGYWMIATDAGAEMPALAFAIVALSFLLRSILLPQPRRIALAGLATSAGCLLHVSSLTLLPAAVLAVLLAEYTQGSPRAERIARWKSVGIYLGASVVPTIVILLLVGGMTLSLRGAGSWRQWFVQGVPSSWWWSWHPGDNVRLDVYAFRRALFVELGGKSGTFHLGGAGSLVHAALYWAALATWFVAVYAILSATAFLLRSHYRPYLLVLLLYGACTAVLFTFISPGDFINWIPVVLTSAVLTAISSSYYYRRRRGGLGWMIGLFFWIFIFSISNYSLYIKSHRTLNSNTWYHQAVAIRRHTSAGDLLVVSGFGDDVRTEQYVEYFAHRTVFSLRSSLSAHHGSVLLTSLDLRGAIANAILSGHHAYALGTIWSDADVRTRLLADYNINAPQTVFSGLQRAAAWQEPSGNGTALESVWKLLPVIAKPNAGKSER